MNLICLEIKINSIHIHNNFSIIKLPNSEERSFKMHNGYTGEYMNAVLPPHASLNSTKNIPYYISDSHQNPSNFLTSDQYELSVSGYKTAENKSSQNSNEPFTNNQEYSHKKSLKLFQRPATAKTIEGKLHLETHNPIINPSTRRGHRKKTLSLNPEEREALESLVEDVIIVGLKDAVLDSDESSDESNFDKKESNLEITRSTESSDDVVEVEKSEEEGTSEGVGVQNHEQLKSNYKDQVSPNNIISSQEHLKRHSLNINNNNNNNFIHNNINKNTILNHNNYMFKAAANRNSYSNNNNNNSTNNSNNTPFKQREPYLNSFLRHNKDATKNNFPLTDKLLPLSNNTNNNPNTPNIKGNTEQMILEHSNGNNNSNSSRQSIHNMLSFNIYPAQLKVAIKHMDSLPPRFLKRLQTGHHRIGGSEPTLQSLSELNLNHSHLDSSLNSVFPVCNQATFSAKTSPVTPSLHLGALSASENNSVCNSVEKDRSKNKQTQLEETKKIIRNLLGDLDQYTDEAINHTAEVSEEEVKGNFHDNYMQQAGVTTASMLTPTFVPADSLFRMNNNRFNSESQLNSLDLRPSHKGSPITGQHTSRQFNSLDVAQAPHRYDLASPLLKKTSLKVDAPVFISKHFQTKSEADKTRTSDPEITLLPGVLNANFMQQQQQPQQRTTSSKQALMQTETTPFEVSPFYNARSQAASNHPLYRGCMPMMNYNLPSNYPHYPMQFNAYNPPTQAPSHHPSLYYNQQYPQHPYQPWMAGAGSVYNTPPNQWYMPRGNMPHYMEQPITGLENEGPWSHHDGELSLEEGRQRVGQLMNKGSLVMVVFLGTGVTNKMRWLCVCVYMYLDIFQYVLVYFCVLLHECTSMHINVYVCAYLYVYV